jgi:aqualysin 1
MALLLGYIAAARAQESGTSMIVVFRAQASFDDFRRVYQADERERQHPEGWRYLDRSILGAVQALETALGFRADHVYSAALGGFAARLTGQQIGVLANHPLVAYIERDGIMTTQAQEIPWGIDRIEADLSSTHAGDGHNAITNVVVFIIDTGIDPGQGDLNVTTHAKMLPFPNFLNTRLWPL